MTVFSGDQAIEAFLDEFDGWLEESVAVYLLGGSAMTIRGLKDQTEDIDLALGVTAEFEHAHQTLRERGFSVAGEPTASFDGVGKTIELYHPEHSYRIDLFERQVVGKVWITDRMRHRAERFWIGDRATAYVLSDEDMFLLKAVSGGDVGSGRRRDIEDMRTFARRGLDYGTIVEEIEKQRPFNIGSTEATHIRNRSHPLFAIETAVHTLSGLPPAFTKRVSGFATEFETEYFVLGCVDDDVRDRVSIRNRVLSAVGSLSADDGEAVEAAIDRLVRKQVLEPHGETVSLCRTG